MIRLSKCVVSYRYDTTQHMCLVKDTTQHKKTQNFFFSSKIVQKIFPHNFMKFKRKNFFSKNYKNILFHFVSFCVVLCHVIWCCVMLYGVVSCHVDWTIYFGAAPFEIFFLKVLIFQPTVSCFCVIPNNLIRFDKINSKR